MLPTIATGNVASATAGGYEVANSVRYNDGDSPKMEKTISAGSNTIGTFSCWVKRCTLGADQALFTSTNDTLWFKIWFHNEDYLRIDRFKVASPYWDILKTTNMKFRDPSAWYHIHVAIDTTDGTAEDRMILTVNGTRVTSFATSTNPGSSVDLLIGTNTYKHRIGANQTSGDFFDGYMAEVVWIDGTASAATNFGEFDEDSPTIWKPQDVSGLSLGTNGYYLDMEASDNLGNDANGGTDFTETNLAATDQATDTPTNNFNVISPLTTTSSNVTISEGNCKITTGTSSWHPSTATIGVTKGKWYCEVKCTDVGSASKYGIIDFAQYVDTTANLAGYTRAWTYRAYGGYLYNNTDDSAEVGYGDSYTTNDIIGIYLDCDNNKVYWAKNGTVQNSGTGISITDGYDYTFAFNIYNSTAEVNFGGCSAFSISSAVSDDNGYGSFEYDPSAGTFDSASKDFYALCTKNLAEYG